MKIINLFKSKKNMEQDKEIKNLLYEIYKLSEEIHEVGLHTLKLDAQEDTTLFNIISLFIKFISLRDGLCLLNDIIPENEMYYTPFEKSFKNAKGEIEIKRLDNKEGEKEVAYSFNDNTIKQIISIISPSEKFCVDYKVYKKSIFKKDKNLLINYLFEIKTELLNTLKIYQYIKQGEKNTIDAFQANFLCEELFNNKEILYILLFFMPEESQKVLSKTYFDRNILESCDEIDHVLKTFFNMLEEKITKSHNYYTKRYFYIVKKVLSEFEQKNTIYNAINSILLSEKLNMNLDSKKNLSLVTKSIHKI